MARSAGTGIGLPGVPEAAFLHGPPRYLGMTFRLGVLLAALAAGCDSSFSLSRSVPDLGDPYVVQSRPEPVVVGDTLYVTVSYSGGCAEHTFDLGARETESTVDLWLTHDANGDLCEAYLTEAVAAFVPVDVRGRLGVFLYTDDTTRVRVQVPEAD